MPFNSLWNIEVRNIFLNSSHQNVLRSSKFNKQKSMITEAKGYNIFIGG